MGRKDDAPTESDLADARGDHLRDERKDDDLTINDLVLDVAGDAT